MKDYLSLTLPGQTEPVPMPQGLKAEFTTLGSFVSVLFNIIIYIMAFLAFYYLVWGAYQYILASGKKEDLARARSRITWAIVGLIVTLLAYFIARFAAESLLSESSLKINLPF